MLAEYHWRIEFHNESIELQTAINRLGERYNKAQDFRAQDSKAQGSKA